MATSNPNVEVQVDLQKIADTYVDIVNMERGQQRSMPDFTDAQIIPQQHNFKNLKLELCDVEWPDNIVPVETKVQKNFDNPEDEAGIYGDFGSEQDVASVNTVKITSGLMRDIGQTLEVPFPDKLETVGNAVGGFLTIDPSRPENEVKQPIKVRGNLGRESVPQGGVTGILVSSEKTYSGRFSGKIYPRGTILLQGGTFGEQEIQKVIRKVSKNPAYRSLLKHMIPDTNPGTENDPQFFWKLEGSCGLRWDFKHDMKWQQKQ